MDLSGSDQWSSSAPSRCDQYDLFFPGQDGNHVCRIPVLLTTKAGVLLACCEARKGHRGDVAETELLIRRSPDLGKTWSRPEVVATEHHTTCGNPVLVQDPLTGIVWLLFCKSPADLDKDKLRENRSFRTVSVTSSDDDGRTWDRPRDITSEIRRPEWSWCATGPGNGIALTTGRLIIPCYHQVNIKGNRSDPSYSHIVYSDDHGQTWLVGGTADRDTNESSVAESVDGHLYLNCRNIQGKGIGNYRAVAWSVDDGETFSPVVHDAGLPEPVCQACILRFTARPRHDRNRVLFSNPGGIRGGKNGRHHLTIRLSYDECRTWPVARVLYHRAAGYSSLAILPDMTIGCLYERGESDWPAERLTFARFNLQWLTDGADALTDPRT